MKYLALLSLGIITFLTALSFDAPKAEAFVCARGVYRAGCARYRDAAQLHVALARWYSAIRGNKHMEMSQLMNAERAAAGLDVDIR